MTRLPDIAGGDRRRPFALLIGAALGQGAMLVASAVAVRDAIGTVRDGGTAMPVGSLILLAVAGIGLAALRHAERVLAERVGQSYTAETRELLFLRLSKAPTSWLAKRRTGALSLRYVGDLTALKNWAGIGLARAISAAVILPAALLVLAAIDPRLVPAAAVPVALAFAVMLRLGPPLSRAHARLRKSRARLAASMSERLQQATALRRAGRIRTERRTLQAQSAEIVQAGIERARLSGATRAMPDMASGVATALTLALCLHYRIAIGETVAALLTLSMIVRPMRHVADIRDRRIGWLIASGKLAQALSAPRIHRLGRPLRPARAGRAALMIRSVPVDGVPCDLKLARGDVRLLQGADPVSSGRLLMLAAGLDEPDAGVFRVLGRRPAELDPQELLYLGGASPSLRGSLRRDVLLGTGCTPADAEISKVLEDIGLGPLLARIGGLDGRVEEGRRNLSVAETRGILLARGLLARPALALIDADGIGFGAADIARLARHFRTINSAALVATTLAGGDLAGARSIRPRPSDATGNDRPASATENKTPETGK
ncbi:ABC transporter transmembrane domain-containing protein [Roseovarius ramblicola]|uniref:ABC transporter transmembrane domain-containing protein n=1 Tax=Roseovarius ramblicola TaxID=2022336 RepID=A0ABV5I1B9_9RHOB